MRTETHVLFHEAIALALLSNPIRTMNFNEVANFIEQRNLYPECSGNIMSEIQIFFSNNNQKVFPNNIFEELGADYIRLRNTEADFYIKLSNALDAIDEYNNSILFPRSIKLKVYDVLMNSSRNIDFSPVSVISIMTKALAENEERQRKKSGEKKFIYVKEVDLKGKETIGIYTIYRNLNELIKQIDHVNNYLTIVSDNTAVNVKFFKLSGKKLLPNNFKMDGEVDLNNIKFSESNAAKQYRKNFEVIQNAYWSRISLGKSILSYRKSENV